MRRADEIACRNGRQRSSQQNRHAFRRQSTRAPCLLLLFVCLHHTAVRVLRRKLASLAASASCAAARFAANSRSTDGDAGGASIGVEGHGTREIRFHINALHVTVVACRHVGERAAAGSVNPDFFALLKTPLGIR